MSDEIEKLKEISNNNKARLDTHEALCALRYEQILEKLTFTNAQVEQLTKKLDAISLIATKGTTSLAAILWAVSAFAGVITFLIFILKNLKML